ncbi:hypothetical protein EDD37DRAFT_654613 [Exophiala viscosa]|nr:hypothetical protein EDD37DRAFT_654613 [Exophiala viscosa]
MVQRLVEAIRNDDSPPNVAKTLQNNIQALHERGELAKKDISETDMITLVLKCLSCPRPRTRTDSTASTAQYDFLGEPSSSHSEWSSASPATHEDFFFDEAFPLQLQSSNCDMAQYSTDSAHSSTDIDSIFTSSTFESQFSFSPTSLASNTSPPTSNSPKTSNFEMPALSYEKPNEKLRFSETNTMQINGTRGHRSFMRGSDCSLRAFTLPLICPGDPINEMVISFRDGARDLLKSGVSLESVMGSGLTDVELLFRLRQPDDEWNVPGWACEMTWGLQDVDWHVQLAEVFMRVRFMRWLILPNEDTFAGIPGILRPTTAQMRFPHSVAIDFLPIPTVRNVLVRRPQDWHTPLIRSKYSCNWNDALGPAIVTDPVTGRRHLSEQFEKHICVYQNWSAGKSILETWPELSGEMRLDKAA